MKTTNRENGSKPSCSCNQLMIEMLRTIAPIKDGMVKEVKCKKCDKSFWADREIDICMDCESKK